MPWQWGQLGLTENDGNRLIKYADAIIDGVRDTLVLPCLTHLTEPFAPLLQASPNDGTIASRSASRSHHIADRLIISLFQAILSIPIRHSFGTCSRKS